MLSSGLTRRFHRSSRHRKVLTTRLAGLTYFSAFSAFPSGGAWGGLVRACKNETPNLLTKVTAGVLADLGSGEITH